MVGHLLPYPLPSSLTLQQLLSPCLGASSPDCSKRCLPGRILPVRHAEPLIEPVACIQHVWRKLQDSQRHSKS
ncbi:hypothetical protein E2320_015531 [Naja naja]|nr:hypothetical protein E2320_015531 [Naja naja]